MRKRNLIIALLLLIFLVVAFTLTMWLKHCGEKPKEVSSPAIEQTLSPSIPFVPTQTDGKVATKATTIEELMQTPIEFYGVVLDQDGKPVSTAKVSATVLDNMMKGTPITTIADADGRFTIQSKGASLHIMVSKTSYDFVDKNGVLKPSSQGFDFGLDNGRGIYQPNAASPVVFQLRKAGNPVPLDTLRGQSRVPRNGTPITIGLSKTSTVSFQISCLTLEDATQPPNAPYDWRCEISVDGGGIQEAMDEHSFIAPDGGYTQLAVIDMPKTLDRKLWNSRVNKNYWLRFPDNTFGKISFMMNARGDHFAVINGFRNPSRNDRNLEPKLDAR